MKHAEGHVTQIAGQLADAMPTRGVSAEDSKEAIRQTLHYARGAGILEELSGAIEAQANGDQGVKALLDELKQR